MSTSSTSKMSIPLAQPAINTSDIRAVTEALQSTSLSMGLRLEAFEGAMAEYVGTRYAIGVNSGTSGLHLCIAANEFGPGDEVITSPFSFVASSNCVLYEGATPVFADIDPDTLALDPEKVAERVTNATRALIPVDVFGEPCPIEDYAQIAQEHDLVIVRDACEAIGSERNGTKIGSLAACQAAVLAFYPNKQMTTGEGGMILTDDSRLASIFRSLRNQGRDDAGTWMNHVRLGYNYRLDEMSAALGLSQLRRLDSFVEKRNTVAEWYGERLANLEGVLGPRVASQTTRMSWFVFVVRLDESIDRALLMERLAADGIPTRPYFAPIHLQPLYRERFGYQPGDFPVTERIAATTLALPFFTEMSREQVDYTCDRIAAHLSGSTKTLSSVKGD